MRTFLICGIVFVHVPFGPETSPYLGLNGLFDWLRVFLGDSLFRIGVPCLSVISGYLLMRRGAASFDYAKVLRSKSMTVLLPFLIWNLGLLAVVLVIQRGGIAVGYFPDLWSASVRELMTQAFAAESLPIDLPLYFLRDLFVCILLSPILLFLLQRAAILTLAVFFVLAIIPELKLVVVLKSSILVCFAFGMFLALRQVDLKAMDRFAAPGAVVTLAVAVCLSIALYITGPEYPLVVDLMRNVLPIVGAFGFWLISAIAINYRMGQRLAATGSLSFWVFCAHYPVLILLYMVWNRVAPAEAYPIFYVGAVVITLVLMVVTNAIALRIMPPVYQLLTGSRGRKEKLAKATSIHSVGSSHPMEHKLSQQRR